MDPSASCEFCTCIGGPPPHIAQHFSQDLQQTWCEGNLEELKRFLQDAVFRGEYVPVGILEIDVIPSEEVFNSFCDHYGLVRTGGNCKGKGHRLE